MSLKHELHLIPSLLIILVGFPLHWGKIQTPSQSLEVWNQQRLRPPPMSPFIMFFLSTFQPSLASSQQICKSKLPWFWTYALASAWNTVSEIFHSSSSFRSQSCYSLSRQSFCNHMHSNPPPHPSQSVTPYHSGLQVWSLNQQHQLHLETC